MSLTPQYVVLEKPVGQTPLEAINAWKVEHPEYAGMPMTYAGRLDPMASGKLLVLLGEECAKRDRYTGLDKEYEIELVLGISTDTGDTLGLPQFAERTSLPHTTEVRTALASLLGTHTVPYPAFSSKTVDGKPLFQYALEGSTDTISIPEHEETIYRAALTQTQHLSTAQLQKRLHEILRVVPRSDESSKVLGADFRQDEIRAAWDSLFDAISPDREFLVISLIVTCASGTYMRTLAARLGSTLDTKGFALSIHRSKIGKFVRLGPLGFWLKEYK